MPSAWRWLRRLLVAFLLALLLVPLAGFVLLASEVGTAWLLQRAAGVADAQGVTLRFERSSGTLLDRFELTGLQLQAGETRLAARRLLLVWRPRALLERRLHIEKLQLDGVDVRPPPGDEGPPAAPTLPALQLPLAVQVDQLLVDGLRIGQAEGGFDLATLALAATLDAQGLQIAGLQLDGEGIALAGELRMQATAPHTLDGRLTAGIDERLSGTDIGAVNLVARLSGPALQPHLDVRVDHPTRLQLRAVLHLDQPAPGFDLDAEWPSLGWPLAGSPRYRVDNGRLALHGTAEDYRLSLLSALELPELPAGDIELSARGSTRGLTLDPLTLRLPRGELQAQGELDWTQGVRWQLELVARRLDPGLFAADWPGAIDGRVALGGSLGTPGQAGLGLAARIHELGGTLRGYPLGASGALEWHAGRLQADALTLASGPNRVELNGRADEVLDLAFAIEAPELASLYPGLAGRLSGSGRLGGSRARPALQAKVSASDLGYQDARAGQVALEVDWRDQGGQGQLQLDGLELAGSRLDRLSAEVEGTPAVHRVSLAAQGPQAQLALGAEGGLAEQVWTGQLQRLRLEAPGVGEWRLDAPAKLRLSSTSASSGPLCLVQAQAELCARGGWDRAAGLDLDGSLRGLELALLAPHLPGEAVVEGRLAGEFQIAGRPERPDLTFDLRPGDGRIRLEEAAEPLDLAFRDARIRGRFADDRGSAELQFGLGTNGRAAGRLTLGPGETAERRLGGEIRADFPDLGLVAGFLPALDEVQGRLRIEAALGGTLGRPQLDGGLYVSDARARVPAAGILLSGVELALQGDGASPLRASGRLQSGEGRIDLNGMVDLAARGGPVVDLAIRGTDFEAARLPEALVSVSPDLRLQGNGPYRLSGVLRIPRAAIELKELPAGTVEPSADEIVVGAGPVEPSRAGPANLTAQVRLELGKAVSFKGFGLSTGLDGTLDARVDQRGTTLDGKIELREGRYKAYGQDLSVERGRLLFAGPPGNPNVDLRAVRVSRDGQVKAYLAMNGPLSKPRPRVYSEPALPEAEAIAYLLTGRGLDQAGQQEGVDIAGAALSLGLSKGEPLLQDMSERLGLDELRIESGSTGLQDSSLILGKYLNPDLYLGYSQGLFNPEGAVLLRLRLSERLEVESRSGAEQSVDLLYRLEHD